jgi:hypothetical protein
MARYFLAGGGGMKIESQMERAKTERTDKNEGEDHE